MKRKIIVGVTFITMSVATLCGCNKSNTQSEPVNVNESETNAEEIVSSTVDDEVTIIEVEKVAPLPTDVEETDIYVEKIASIPSDFIKGMDVSSVLAEEASGVKYYDKSGKEEDVFKLLAEAGVNYARIRVWNDPYDEAGNGYGGGNCDIDCAAALGARATKYGMKTCIDFHYSDFWADPNKQMVPKAWAEYDHEELSAAISEYTRDSLNKLIAAGIDVGMVQIGNEINNGLAGEKNFDKELELLVAAADAVRGVSEENNSDIKIVVHFTAIDDPEHILKIAGQLEGAGVDYDVFGVSYYPFWHGTMDNMSKLLADIKSQYGKETCVMETSYPFTNIDADGSANSVSGDDALTEYPVSVQGQANCIRDIMAQSAKAGSLGIFYWEGCWIAPSTDYSANKKLYEENGSGWASSYAGEYDPNDAGKYYGGCSWDNQALFDAEGKALASLDVFKYVNYGAVGGEVEIIAVPELVYEIQKGSDFELPSEIDVVYNDTSVTTPAKVIWDEAELAAMDVNTSDTYIVNGTTEDGHEVSASIKVSSLNYVVNPGFEDADATMWVTNSAFDEVPTDVQNKAADAYEGDKALHWWSSDEQEFDTYQDIENIPAGTYRINAYVQGGDVGDDADIYMYVNVLDGDDIVESYQSDPVKLSGWIEWQNPTITGIDILDGAKVQVGMHINCAAGGWGTFDAVELVQE